MYNPNDLTFDEEQFIREHLNFLNESDDDIFEGSEISSIQFTSYEETKSIYGISPINSKVSETWSSNSSGSITSAREVIGPTSSTTFPPSSNFSKQDWYSPFFVEDISFGQDFIASTTKEIDSILYKVWSETFANKSMEYFLRENILRRENLFSGMNPINARMQAHSAYSKLACEMWPYSNLATSVPSTSFVPNSNLATSVPSTSFVPNRSELPLSYLNHCFKSKSLNEASRSRSAPIPIFQTHHTPVSVCGAEEALNKYFAQQSKLENYFHEPELSKVRPDFSLPIGRSSTPINNSSREYKPQQFPAEQSTSGDVAGALTPEDFIRQFGSLAPDRKKSSKKSTSLEALSLEGFVKTDSKATNTVKPAKNSRSAKHYEFCKFCYKNGELSDIYMSHVTKSSDGTIVCPILRKYVCDLCGATGDKAHTRKYCSLNTQQSRRHPVFRRLTNGVLTSCHNHK